MAYPLGKPVESRISRRGTLHQKLQEQGTACRSLDDARERLMSGGSQHLSGRYWKRSGPTEQTILECAPIILNVYFATRFPSQGN